MIRPAIMVRSVINKIRLFITISRLFGLRHSLSRVRSFLLRKLNFLSDDYRNQSITSEFITGKVCVSILMPVFNTPSQVLKEAIESVLLQTYTNWELCICDDASTDIETLKVLSDYQGTDPRLKIIHSPKNIHIAAASNLASQFATGGFIGFLDHDDTLEPRALELVVRAIEENSEADVIYTDEDKIDINGIYSEPYYKPNWSPEHLTSVMYILHFLVIRKSLFFEIGGLRGEYTGAQDYDLALRATHCAREVVHIPHVLYHWRKIHGSAAEKVDAKPDALINAKRALQDFTSSNFKEFEVRDGFYLGSFYLRQMSCDSQPVTLLILTDSGFRNVDGRGAINLVEHTVNSILEKSTFKNYQILVIDNGKMTNKTRNHLLEVGAKVIDYKFSGNFNYSKKLNFAFKHVKTEDVIVLNDDLEVISEDWIESLLSYSRKPGIGAVGAMLVYPNGKIQHAGVVMGVNGISTHVFHNTSSEEISYAGYSHLVRNYSAVTGAVLATKMSLVKLVGGFDENLAVDYNDIDFCLKLRSRGYRIVYTPFARLYHFEGSTLIRKQVSESDKFFFLDKWQTEVSLDPYYNINLPK